ncbi:hypothetical protein GCM10009678_71790 [Actinomadura kijaniata]|uniref:SnoaL-like domain-containing protein n=1 Tax=Actinomadura namibiensis TaxID=182080 RepID=A0A7W3LRZ4_ACTNM|nr:hypothetical protein [Actinomadura namibiensis]MBA8953224.1 hypothetical protein [Actinomadura namibiensis]
MDPRAAARTDGAEQRPAGRRDRRPGRPGHPGRVGRPGLPGGAQIDDPAERVAFVQLASSARRRVRASQPSATRAVQRADVVRDFKRAWEAKNIDALIGLLDPDATAIADGGGLATTFPHPIEGGEQIAHAWVEIARRRPGGMTFLERTVNGRPGVVAQQDGVVVTVFAFEVVGDRITRIWVVRNPEKLRHWTTG